MKSINDQQNKINLPTNKIINSLTELGLNKYESLVYLTLVSEGVSTAKNISDIASIPYGKVYEIINSLASRGFVLIIPSKPMKCQAINPSEIIKIVRTKTSKKFDKIESTISRHLEPVFKERKKFIDSQNDFRIVNGRSNINKRIDGLINKAKKNICIICTENALKRLVIHKELLKEVKDRKVEVKIISNLTKNNMEDVESLNFCEVKHKESITSNLFSIDGKECLLVESIPDDDNIIYGRDQGMWISNQSFVQLFENSFRADYNNSRLVNEKNPKSNNP